MKEAGQSAEFWGEWWKTRLSKGTGDTHPMLPAPLTEYRGRWYDLANKDNLLIAIMREYGLRTVLCAGNGVSQEPHKLAAAGFDVTALDISPIAVAFAEKPQGLSCILETRRTGGHAQFVVGNLLDTTVCPGPFDVIIERRTVQRFAEQEWATALEALSGRLSKTGLFLSQCLDDSFPPERGWAFHETGLFHASEGWFREHRWAIWDGAPSSTVTGRVAWLIRSGSMKPPPSAKGNS
jgi:hypothetical protein